MSIANPYSIDTDGDVSLRRRATVASLTLAVVLIAAKLAAYLMTGAVTVLTSLLDSTFDAMASTVTMISVLHAATPADHGHRFGHGKVEALAAFAQSIFIFGSAAYLLYECAARFLHPQEVRAPLIGMGVMIFSSLGTVALVTFQRHVIRKTNSVAIGADYMHYSGDLFMNLGVLLSLGLGYFLAWPYFDPLFAAGAGLFMLYGAWKIGRESYGILMDAELPDDERATIEALVRAHPKARAIHDLRTRSGGQRVFIEFHLEMDGGLTLAAAHDVTEELELALYKAFPTAEVLIHQEPAGIDDHRLDDTLKRLT